MDGSLNPSGWTSRDATRYLTWSASSQLKTGLSAYVSPSFVNCGHETTFDILLVVFVFGFGVHKSSQPF